MGGGGRDCPFFFFGSFLAFFMGRFAFFAGVPDDGNSVTGISTVPTLNVGAVGVAILL